MGLLSFHEMHTILGHAYADTIASSSSLYTDGHLIPRKPKGYHCHDCALAKSTHTRPMQPHTPATHAFELVHSDLSGKFSIPSLGKNLYYITLIDDYTRFAWIYLLKKKDQAAEVIKRFITMIKTQFDVTLKRFRTDGGGEYVNSDLRSYFATQGTIHEITPPYSHESNSVAERFNRTLKNIIRAMLGSSEKYFLWGEAVNTAVYIRNRLPHRALGKVTPYEKLYGQQPSIAHLQSFGRSCYVHIPKETRPSGSTLLPRAVDGIFTGYTDSTKVYRVYIPSKRIVTTTSQVRFAPTTTQQNTGTMEPDTATSIPSESTNFETLDPDAWFDDEDTEPLDHSVDPINNAQRSPSPPPAPQTKEILSHVQLPPPPQKPEDYLAPGLNEEDPDYLQEVPDADTLSDDELALLGSEPVTYAAATRLEDWNLWELAVKAELDALHRNKTWEVVPTPSDRRIVDCK